MITAWRLCEARRTAEAFAGHGAAKFPGRWNPLGTRAIYLAENRSLAALEVLANAANRDQLTATSWTIIQVQFDPTLIWIPKRLPDDWRRVPAPEATRKLGGNWVKDARSAVLRVPSAVTLGEFNYVLNPLHPDFSKLKIGAAEAFSFDARIT